MIKSTMDYLDSDSELSLLKIKSTVAEPIRSVLTESDIAQLRKAVARVHMHESVMGYVRDLMRASRDLEQLDLGLSPRGGIHLMFASKARALLSSRNYVIPDDVKFMAHKVLDHRLILSPEAELEGQSQAGITDGLLSAVAAPKGSFKEED